MLELSLGRGAGGRILAHTHGGVALIDLAHFALLAVVVQAGVCGKKQIQKQLFLRKWCNPIQTLSSPLLQHFCQTQIKINKQNGRIKRVCVWLLFG